MTEPEEVEIKQKPDGALDDDAFKRLVDSIDHSSRKLYPFRRDYRLFIEQYAGNYYGENGPKNKVLVNVIAQLVELDVQQLASNRPRVIVDTFVQSLKPFAANFGLAIDQVMKDIDIESALSRMVLEAEFSVAIVKVGETASGTIVIDGETHQTGQIYAEIVALSDYVFDTTAKSEEMVQFEADYLWVTVEEARSMFPENKNDITSMTKLESKTQNDGGDAEVDFIDSDETRDAFMPKVQLCNPYLPKQNRIIWYAVNKPDVKLSDEPYDGPKGGPYVRWGFNDVPQSVMPLSPMANIYELHKLHNNLWSKNGRQARGQKTVLVHRRGFEDDVKAIIAVKDGGTIAVDDIDAMKEISLRHADPQNILFGQNVGDKLNEMAGNPQLRSGAKAQSETLGQDKILAVSTNQTTQKKHDRVMKATRSIISKIAWYIYHDPFINMSMMKTIEGIDVPVRLDADSMEGDFLDLNFSIEPWSMQSKTPPERMENITQFVTFMQEFLGQQMAEAGQSIDTEMMVQLYAELTNEPRILDVIKSGAATLAEEFPRTQQQPRQNAHTSRTTIRKNVSDGGQERAAQQQALQSLAAKDTKEGVAV